MKMRMTFKTPDAAKEGAEKWAAAEASDAPNAETEWADIITEKKEAAFVKLSKWISNGEYITVEFDLEKMTAIVVEKEPVSEPKPTSE